MKKLICYCYNYSEADIIAHYAKNKGRSSILAQIAQVRKNKTLNAMINTLKNDDVYRMSAV